MSMLPYETRVDRELLLNFFLTFSRFEYALKASGLFKRTNPQRDDPSRPWEAQPDWDTFAVSLRCEFQLDRTETLKRACEYILDSPPLKQVITDDLPSWETPVRPSHESDVEFLLRMVRCVRNNLFHGGKHSNEIHEDIERTEMLLKSSLTILDEGLALSPKVKSLFDEAAI